MYSKPQKDGKPPLKVVVVGLEGQSPARARELGRHFQGVISRFYNAARQNSDNSAGDVWHQRLKLPANQGLLRYASNQGMETLTIQLNPAEIGTLPEELEPKKKPPMPDWCVVDFVVPDSDELKVDFAAFLTDSEGGLGQEEDDSVDLLDTSEDLVDHDSDPETPDVLLKKWGRFARQVPYTYESPITNRVASLKLDLRDVAPGDRVTVTVFGRVVPNDPPDAGVEAYRTISVPFPETPNVLYEDSSGDVRRYRHLEVDTLVHFAPSDAVSSFDESGTPFFTDHLGNDFDNASSASSPDLLALELHQIWLDAASVGWDEVTFLTPGGTVGKPSDWTFTQAGNNSNYRMRMIDADTGLVWKEQRYAFSYGTITGLDTTIDCDTHGLNSSTSYWSFIAKESTQEWEIHPEVPPEHYDGAPCDITYAFYFGDPVWEVGKTQHQDVYIGPPADDYPSIWTLKQENPTERKALDVELLIPYDPAPGYPNDYGLLGVLTVDRLAQTVKFVPA